MTDQPNRVVALTSSVTLEPNDPRRLASLCGPFDQNLKFIERRMGVRIRNRGNEFGSVTGRPRRCGWFDVPLLRYTAMINGFDSLIITKLDVLDTFVPTQSSACAARCMLCAMERSSPNRSQRSGPRSSLAAAGVD